jgi:hypothetical protein
VTKHKEPFGESGKRGYREGWEEGFEDGLIESCRGTLRALLQVRGFQASDYQQGLIDGCTDLATLQRWSEAALTAARADDIFK